MKNSSSNRFRWKNTDSLKKFDRGAFAPPIASYGLTTIDQAWERSRGAFHLPNMMAWRRRTFQSRGGSRFLQPKREMKRQTFASYFFFLRFPLALLRSKFLDTGQIKRTSLFKRIEYFSPNRKYRESNRDPIARNVVVLGLISWKAVVQKGSFTLYIL